MTTKVSYFYIVISNELDDLKKSIYSKIERVNKSRENFSRQRSHIKKSRGGKRHRSRGRSHSSSSGSRSSSESSNRSRRENRSRSILGRLKGDLAECDNLQNIKYTTILKDKQSLESTNKEFANLVKEMKRKLQEEQEKYHDIHTQFKLQEASSKRVNEEFQKQSETIKDQDKQIKDLKNGVITEKDLLMEKKEKWRQRFCELQSEIDGLKEQNISLENRATSYEQLTVSQDALLTEEKQKIRTIEHNLTILRSQLDDARNEAINNQERTQAQETELTEVTVRLQYETGKVQELKSTIEKLTADLQQKDKAMEDFKIDQKQKRDALLDSKNDEIAKLLQVQSQLKSDVEKSEYRCREFESALEDTRYKLDDSIKQLNIAEIKLTDLVKEKELVMELKSVISDRERDLDMKKDYSVVRSSYIEIGKRSVNPSESARFQTARN
jgi:chromosome segregation ATPase